MCQSHGAAGVPVPNHTGDLNLCFQLIHSWTPCYLCMPMHLYYLVSWWHFFCHQMCVEKCPDKFMTLLKAYANKEDFKYYKNFCKEGLEGLVSSMWRGIWDRWRSSFPKSTWMTMSIKCQECDRVLFYNNSVPSGSLVSTIQTLNIRCRTNGWDPKFWLFMCVLDCNTDPEFWPVSCHADAK